MPDALGSGSGTWEAVLGALESRLAAWRLAAEGTTAPPEPFTWPQGPGPCPEALRPRALALLDAQREVEAAMAARLAEIDERRRGLGRRATAPSGPALYVDDRA